MAVRLRNPLPSVYHEEHDIAVRYGFLRLLQHHLGHAGVGRALAEQTAWGGRERGERRKRTRLKHQKRPEYNKKRPDYNKK